jgi:Leucine-rich repeat (LRR) protein
MAVRSAFMPSGQAVIDLTGKGLDVFPTPSKAATLLVLRLKGNRIRRLPEKLPSLTTLTLSANGLSEIPPELGRVISRYKNLECLDLSSNGLCTWPKELETFERIRQIIASENKLSAFHCACRSLEHVELQQNSFTEIPKLPSSVRVVTLDFNRISSLAASFDSVTKLTLSLNSITTLREFKAPHLEFLDVSRNKITQLPKLTGMKRLRALDCSDNFVSEVPKFPRGLREVSFRGNRLTSFPDIRQMCPSFMLLDIAENEIESLPQLPPVMAALWINGNRLKTVPGGKLPELKRMLASHNEFTDLLPYTGNRVEEYMMPYNKITRIDVRLLGDALVRLDLSGNCITALPAELFRLLKLDFVVLPRNRITSIPEQWSTSAITTFNISCNPLEGLPQEWPIQLQHLLISYCGLSALPDGLSALLQLEELCACGNSLSTIPIIPNCRVFYLSRNNFVEMPPVPQSTVILDLAMNGLLQLPDLVLPALEELDVSHNDIHELPTLRLPALKCLKVSHNLRLSSDIVVRDFPLLHTVNVEETQIQFSGASGLRELMTSQRELFTGSAVKYIEAGDSVGFAEMTGLRETMEDSILVREHFESNASLFGVFDGHAGARTAIYAAYVFAKYLHDRDLTPETLQEIFGQANELIRATNCRDGSTAVVAIRHPDRIICGHLGDARLVIVRDDGTIKFQTEDHKPQLRKEFERIRDQGSKVVAGRTGGILVVSRATGDFLIPGVGGLPKFPRYRSKSRTGG